MKIAYFGLPLGAWLLARDGRQLDPVVLAPVDAPGRRRLARLGLRLYDARAAGAGFEAQVERALAEARPEVLLSWFWTRKLPERWLALPRGAIGIHPSLLPRHRGPNPYFWTIDSGDSEAGATAHYLSGDYDTGDLIASRSVPVLERDAWQLARALDRPSLALLREIAQRLERGDDLPGIPQDERQATWAPEPSGDALRVDFGWTTERVLRRMRALSPTPGLALDLEDVRFFVTRAEVATRYVSALLPGEAELSDALFLRTGDGALRVTEAHFPDPELSVRGSREVLTELRRRMPA